TLRLGAVLVFNGPAVIVVHVEDQIGGDLVLDDPRQQNPRQEALAGPTFAEDAHRPLDQPSQVEVNLRFFEFQRRADVEMRRVLAPEHVVHIVGGCDLDRHEMAGDGLHRAWFALFLVNGEHRRDMDRPESRCARVNLAQKWVREIRRVAADGGVSGVKRDVGDHAEETLVAAAHNDVTPHGQVFDYRLAGKLDIEPPAQRAADHHAEALPGHHQTSAGWSGVRREPVVEPVRLREQCVARRHDPLPRRSRTLVLINYTANTPECELSLYCSGPGASVDASNAYAGLIRRSRCCRRGRSCASSPASWRPAVTRNS